LQPALGRGRRMSDEPARIGGDAPPRCFVTRERYFALLDALRDATRALEPAPDCVVGIKRSGLFPAVYLSQQCDLPMFINTELASFPYPRLSAPLVVDTTAWTGATIRRAIARLQRRGVSEVRVLVMIARESPPPQVERLAWLETARHVPRFWYDE
jgi:hypoxanthine phosphoribosyltransferase